MSLDPKVGYFSTKSRNRVQVGVFKWGSPRVIQISVNETFDEIDTSIGDEEYFLLRRTATRYVGNSVFRASPSNLEKDVGLDCYTCDANCCVVHYYYFLGKCDFHAMASLF